MKNAVQIKLNGILPGGGLFVAAAGINRLRRMPGNQIT